MPGPICDSVNVVCLFEDSTTSNDVNSKLDATNIKAAIALSSHSTKQQ